MCGEHRDACVIFFFSSRRRHTIFDCDWSSDVCSSDLFRRNPMTSIKCPQCGVVTLRTNTNCKRCGATFNAAAGPRPVTGPRGTKILVIAGAAGALLVIAVLGMAIWSRLATFAETDSSPIAMATLLNAEGKFKSPVNVRLLSELHDEFAKNDIDQKRFLQNYPEVSVLEQLGLVSVDNFKVIKA